jgi:hypothetical protein
MDHHNTIEDDNRMKNYLRKRDIESIDKLIKNKNYDVNIPLNRSNTPILFHFIHMILTQCNESISDVEFKIIKLIIESKANINHITGRFNALTLIYKKDRPVYETERIIKLLLENKAVHNPSTKNSALKYAVNSKEIEYVELLLTHGITFDSSIFGSYCNHFNKHKVTITKLLLDHIDPTISLKKVFKDVNSLRNLCNMGCLNAVKQLIVEEKNIDKLYHRVRLYGTETFVYDASLIKIVNIHLSRKKVHNDYVEIAKVLINYGADTNKISRNGIIEKCVMERNNIISECLLKYFPKVLVNIIICYNKN